MENPENNGQPAATPETKPEELLPSEQADVVTDEQWVKDNTHDNGKLLGRFSTVAEMAEYYRNQEVTHTNNMREIKEGQREQQKGDETALQALQAERKREETLVGLVPQFMENNMQLTDEMMTAAKDAGITQTDIELGAYKLREAVGEAHTAVGGKENYDQMMQWAGENLPDNLKSQFDNSIKDLIDGKTGVGLLAIEGLWGRYQSGEQKKPTQESGYRIEGTTQTKTEGGYKTVQEMLTDKRAADRSKDPAMLKKYQEKLSRTPDSVVFGR